MRSPVKKSLLLLYFMFVIAPIYWLVIMSLKSNEEILGGLGGRQVRVRTSHLEELGTRLQDRGCAVRRIDDHEAHVTGSSAAEVGDLAHAWGLPLHHLSDVEQSLEQAFLELTSDSVEFHGTPAEVA